MSAGTHRPSTGFPPGIELPGPLVSVDWLAAQDPRADLVVLDATVFGDRRTHEYVSGRAHYREGGHIPRALFADMIQEFSDPTAPLPFTRPSEAQFAGAAGRLGIDERSTIVIYDAATPVWACRLWWTFRSFGHDRVAVLDGGLAAWRAAGLPLEHGERIVPPARAFPARPRDGFWIDKSGVEKIVRGDEPGTLVCAVGAAQFHGLEPGGRAVSGHIPGSANVPAGSLIEPGSRRFRELAALSAGLERYRGGRVVVYCGTGVAATAVAFALVVLGSHEALVYDGSLSEWVRDPAAPLSAG